MIEEERAMRKSGGREGERERRMTGPWCAKVWKVM